MSSKINKSFLKWTRADSCFKKDNIISTDWHERLEKLPVFVPSYARCKPEMVYILSMEYARMWQKEKNEWFRQIFKLDPKQQDAVNRRRKLRKEIQEQKKHAEIKIRERKERIEREKKAKAEAEALEKAKRSKGKVEKYPAKIKSIGKDKKNKKEKQLPEPEKTEKNGLDNCTHVELTIQCECEGQKEKNKIPESENVTNKTEEEFINAEKQELEKDVKDMICDPTFGAKQVAEAIEKAQTTETKETENKNEELMNNNQISGQPI